MKNQPVVKLVIIGDCGVGKTNILLRYSDNAFKLNYLSTIGVDFKVKTVIIDGQRIKFQIWDTAGQQRYRNIIQAYYKNSAGIILTYAVNDEQSFLNIQKWMKQINAHTPENVVKILVGNKIDVNEDERQVQTLEGKTLADRYAIPFIEVSAKTGQNIEEVFTTIGSKIIREYLPNLQNSSNGMSLSKQLEKQKNAREKPECQC